MHYIRSLHNVFYTLLIWLGKWWNAFPWMAMWSWVMDYTREGSQILTREWPQINPGLGRLKFSTNWKFSRIDELNVMLWLRRCTAQNHCELRWLSLDYLCPLPFLISLKCWMFHGEENVCIALLRILWWEEKIIWDSSHFYEIDGGSHVKMLLFSHMWK